MSLRGRMGYAFKVVVSHVLYYAGLLQLWQSIVLRRKTVVLTYHRVLTGDERRRSGSHPALVVDRETFARQMALLRRRFRVLTIQEFAACLESGRPLPDSSCVITFDDGWRDNFTNAAPILAQHDLPALVFLPVNYIGRPRVFWQEALTHLLRRVVAEVRRSPARRSTFEALLAPTGLDLVLNTPHVDPRVPIIEAVDAQKKLTRAEIEALIAALARDLGVGVEEFAATDGFVDWQQVDQMSRQGITFGGHGAEHLLLTEVSDEQVEGEIRASKAVIDGKLGEPVPTFSYPNGYFSPKVAKKVKDCGYRLAFVTRRGFVESGDDPFSLPRRSIHDGAAATTPMFLARVVGLW